MEATVERVYPRTTEEAVIGMLTENTGSHFLDSGGAYGRNWERNQKRDFAKEPRITTRFSMWGNDLEVEASISTYHWMVRNLEFDPEMQARLDQYADDHHDDNWFEIAEGFAEQDQQRMNDEWGCDSKHFPRTTNTYNETDHWDLDQTLQFIELAGEGGYDSTHLILQVHGGCDVRGGYTAPKCFRLRTEDYEWLDSAKASSFSAGEWYWDYDTRWSRYGPETSSIQDDPKACPPTLPKDLLKAPTFTEGGVPGEYLDSWHIEIAGDGKCALLVPPKGYTHEGYDTGPWPITVGNIYM